MTSPLLSAITTADQFIINNEINFVCGCLHEIDKKHCFTHVEGTGKKSIALGALPSFGCAFYCDLAVHMKDGVLSYAVQGYFFN